MRKLDGSVDASHQLVSDGRDGFLGVGLVVVSSAGERGTACGSQASRTGFIWAAEATSLVAVAGVKARWADKLASQPRRPQPRRERPARGDPGHWEGIIAHTLSHFRQRHRPVSEATASELPAGPSLARLPPPPREANASQLLPAATGPPSRRRRTQMLKPLGWPRRPAPPRAPALQRPDPSLTAPESEARALRGHPTDSDSDPRA